MADHRSKSKGARAERLAASQYGHAEALFLEQVWWPVLGTFEHLAPEYEIRDFKDGIRFLDFAYFGPDQKLCIEIDGYSSHLRDTGRWQFADHLMRQNHLVLDGWTVLRFAYDLVREKPRSCQQLLQQFFGKSGMGNVSKRLESLSVKEREVIRILLADRGEATVTVKEAAIRLKISERSSERLLKKMTSDAMLVAASAGKIRTHKYRVDPVLKAALLQGSAHPLLA
ncbi:DNA-binding response regulator [Paenibacillus sp. IB182496]|uniref:DNA-binding response regulator n=1 Tax=Paenibacillus sabuli TaxID=2772509 RepID=A0A927BVY8_9BACL|nr:DNA-binding response regulator [Paenibacillus sabuli]